MIKILTNPNEWPEGKHVPYIFQHHAPNYQRIRIDLNGCAIWIEGHRGGVSYLDENNDWISWIR